MNLNLLFYKSLLMFFDIMRTLILVRIVLSYIKIKSLSFVSNLVYGITEPILSFSRGIIGKLKIDTGIFDFSPIVAFLLMDLIEYIVGSLLF